MLALSAVVAGIFLGLALGGNARNLGTVKFCGGTYLVLGVLLQILVRLLPGIATRALGPTLPYAYPISLGFVLAFIWSNRRLGRAVWLILAGCGLNVAVILANSGRMPVSLPALQLLGYDGLVRILQAGASGTHVILTAGATRLPYLADLFALRPLRFAGVFSVGDILLVPGVLWLTVQVMGGCSRRREMLE